MFIINPIIFYQTLTFGTIISKVSLTVALFALCMTLAMMLEYIGGLHRRMKIKNTENVRLLDGMHEGLLILDDLTKKENEEAAFMFCNKNAKKLLNNYIAKVDDDSKSALHEQGFLPVVLEGIKSSLSFSNRKD